MEQYRTLHHRYTIESKMIKWALIILNRRQQMNEVEAALSADDISAVKKASLESVNTIINKTIKIKTA